jgi:hypothetical protein
MTRDERKMIKDERGMKEMKNKIKAKPETK